MEYSKELLDAYEQDSYLARMKSLRIAYLVTLTIMPVGYLTDYVMYYDHINALISLRTTSIILLGAYFSLYQYTDEKQYPIFLKYLLIGTILTTLSVMIFITGGVESTYFSSLNLGLILTSLLLILSIYHYLSILLFVIFCYLVSCYFANPDLLSSLHNKQLLVNNLCFIILTGLIGSAFTYQSEKSRFKQFILRYTLEQRTVELEQVNKIKSTLFANINHEFRTPLTLILSPVEDLLRSNQQIDFKVKNTLLTVRDNSYRLLKLVNDLLKIIKLEENSHQLDSTSIDMKLLIRGIISSITSLATQQKLTITLNFKPHDAYIHGNLEALETTFKNILLNAIKFTPKYGSISIKVWSEHDTLFISITDTGIGISKENQKYIFQRFKQVDSSSTRNYSGTGIGLALVHDFTLAQKGTITVESTLGNGSTFTLSFPLINPTDKILSPDSQQPPSQSIQDISRKADISLRANSKDVGIIPFNKDMDKSHQLRLLIIEDEPDMRSYLVNSLYDYYHIFTASNGQEGIDLSLQHHPDIVLTDLMLPKLDGLEVCQQIKQNTLLKFTKVILLTARNDNQSKFTALKKGADDFLTKPFSTIELKIRLSNLSKTLKLEKGLEEDNKKLKKALTDLKGMKSQLLHSEKINAIGSLAAGLLHEVNNPLNYTIIAAKILQEDEKIKVDNNLAELVNDINDGMTRIKTIVKDLRTFAYPEKADIKTPYNLENAVKSALRFTASITADADITSTIPSDIIVTGSERHIVQVFINLITNSTKALEKTISPMIKITAVQNKSDKNRIIVCIEDNGEGISPDNITRIFDPFFTTRDVGEGLGLGLSTCHTIIENNGGTLRAESVLGQYTLLKFDLPLADTY